DLGALVLGMLLAGHPKAKELAKSLLSFKDLFLVGFFLSVGMTALPGWGELLAALLLIVFLPIKVAVYLGLFTTFKLRARTAWWTSLTLANYSEFGLIVGTIAAAAGWLPKEWLAIVAIALSISFIIAAPIATAGDRFYMHWRPRLKRLERAQRLPGDEDLEVGRIDAVVFGMGRVGSAVYDAIMQESPDRVLGVDQDEANVQDHLRTGRNVVVGDGTNPDFWSRSPNLSRQLKWVVLTMPSHPANLAAAAQLRELGFAGRIAATTKYPDQAAELEDLGVELAFNIYAEAGAGFANDLRLRFHRT
ncbi:MAG: cation:proton antiporter, partial [Alphaproteobacteria bacterium]|nr:cation:proton antiporter [Alphaproteobacteria bacterium]